MSDIDKLPGIKEDELVKLGKCAVCRRPMLDKEKGGPTFYRVKIERAAFCADAIESRVGLQMILGGSDALARAMGPDRDLAKIFDGPHDVVVHEGCATDIRHLLLLVPEAPADEAGGGT